MNDKGFPAILLWNFGLEQAIEARAFRRDLFYRLAGVHVQIPPLRERREDVIALATLRLQQLVRERGVERVVLGEETAAMLVHAPLKGNGRELQAVIETAFERCIEAHERTLTPEHFVLEMRNLRPSYANPGNPGKHAANDDTLPTISFDDNGFDDAEPVPLMPNPAPGLGSVMDNPQVLRLYLSRFKTPSGRWNLSAAHRLLVESGQVTVGRRAFADQVRRLLEGE